MTAVGQNQRLSNPFVRVLWLTLVKYSEIDGQQRAASFAYYAFFALFPLILLLVAIGSSFFEASKVGAVVQDYVGHFLVANSGKHDLVHDTVRQVIKERRGVGAFAVLGLLWSSLRFFQSLVSGVNRAWGTHEYSWWRLPLQNLLMVGLLVIAMVAGFVTPILLHWAIKIVAQSDLPVGSTVLILGFDLVRLLLPSAVLFGGFSLFYMLAPRKRVPFADIWVGALVVTALLQTLQALFLLYARNVANFGAVYGAFGSVIAVMIWIYLSGCVIILGGCFCAARAEVGKGIGSPIAKVEAESETGEPAHANPQLHERGR